MNEIHNFCVTSQLEVSKQLEEILALASKRQKAGLQDDFRTFRVKRLGLEFFKFLVVYNQEGLEMGRVGGRLSNFLNRNHQCKQFETYMKKNEKL